TAAHGPERGERVHLQDEGGPAPDPRRQVPAENEPGRIAPALERSSRRYGPRRTAAPAPVRGRPLRRSSPPAPACYARHYRPLAGHPPRAARLRGHGGAGHRIRREPLPVARHQDPFSNHRDGAPRDGLLLSRPLPTRSRRRNNTPAPPCHAENRYAYP